MYKTLERAGGIACAMGAVMQFLFWWFALWFSAWMHKSGYAPVELTLAKTVLSMAFAIAFAHSLVSKLPFTGKTLAISMALGSTLALMVNFSLSIEDSLLAWALFSIVEYLSGLVRIARLKRQGYAEEQPEEK